MHWNMFTGDREWCAQVGDEVTKLCLKCEGGNWLWYFFLREDDNPDLGLSFAPATPSSGHDHCSHY